MSAENGQPVEAGSDKVLHTLVEALKQGMAEECEQRLYRNPKFSGLFAARSGVAGEAAALAVRDGYLDIVRTESKGKSSVDWVRITPKGVDLVMQRESPVRAMDELRAALQLTSDGLPAWLAQFRKDLQELSGKFLDQVTALSKRLDSLSDRIEEALDRTQESTPRVPAGTVESYPWAQDVLTYLNRRRESGIDGPCPLPELFGSLRARHEDLSVQDFHTGLRRLHDRALVKLIPFDGTAPLPQPEYALLDGACVYYHVGR
ncbi:MAG: hypothetical protein FJ271_23345 [Planctomycetes bacterium]|nr:hypothetical protein [Planctomycetota bacterium]